MINVWRHENADSSGSSPTFCTDAQNNHTVLPKYGQVLYINLNWLR